MTSKTNFVVFVYPERATDAIPAGRLTLVEHHAALLQSTFGYGKQYVQRRDLLALDPLTLALPGPGESVLREPPITANGQLIEFGVFRDAAPDHWGRKLIENKLHRTGPLPESIYLAHAGSNRTGALDFRDTPNALVKTNELAQLLDLGYLKEAAEKVEAGEQIPARLEKIFEAGPTMGGARPKAVVEANQHQWLAKFPLRSDTFSVPHVEYATLSLAREAGLDVPAIRLEDIGENRPVLLIERFDRVRIGNDYSRRHFLSALTMLARHEADSPHTHYADIAEAIATHGAASTIRQDQAELFGRMIFNILVHNNDDHLRNHGFIWDANLQGWRLSPLYDVVPMPAFSQERSLHLGVGLEGRLATLPNAMSRHGVFGLTRPQAIAIINRIANTVREWKNTFEASGVPSSDIDRLASAIRHPREVGIQEIKMGNG
ncbi:type II toxin-antitoxin system HipA family toxin [Chitinimonas sp. BJB300]|uniref:type II toxin-antitoxin system HipA family toxin n=1 Tax=Chitinimonas sp. BJB300 TaxID=1559339 RepID=UPI0013042505|nr:HipA domain-containing protein [Chitinimonas sp. BJB300]